VLTRYLLRAIRLFFIRVGQGSIAIPGFDSDWALPTDRIVRLLGDEPLRRAMGEQGHRRFEAEFTADQFSRRVVPFVEAALTGEAAHLAAVRVTPR